MELMKSFSDLLFPERCISCGVLGSTLCTKCRRSWSPRIYRTHLTSAKLTVTSSILYSTVAQRIILAAKESQIKVADRLVADAIEHSITQVLSLDWIDTLIPIPSRSSATRLRGRQFVESVTTIAARSSGVAIATPLIHSRKIRDQSGLSHQQRRNNLDGALVVERRDEPLGRVLLVDDLITTGATLAEAARALRYAGIEVIGAVTAALAQPVR